MNEGNTNKRNLILKIIIAILILIILYLFYLNFRLLQNKLNQRIPSGNMDIFNITCNQNCKCDEEVNGSQNEEGEQLEISDNREGDFNISWQTTNKLNIFSNPFYEGENIIAPLSTNAYQFVIKNETKYNVKYKIYFNEINEYKINMQYRLKKNGEYIIGDENTWVKYNDLNIENNFLNVNLSDIYYLEWKWVESKNDTQVGSSKDARYSLNIVLSAEQI